MKSFSVVKVNVVLKDEMLELKFDEGIIVNNETGEDPWLIELAIDKSYEDKLRPLLDQEVQVLVTITRPANTPANFIGWLRSINALDDMISVIFRGDIKLPNPKYPEELLKQLVDRGLSGDELLDIFSTKMSDHTGK